MATSSVSKSSRKYWAEAIGTFWLIFAGIGTVLLGSGGNNLNIGIAFGLAVLTAVYAIGRVSGGHYNPAITVGLAVGGRFPNDEVLPYILSQLIGGTIAAFILWLIASGKGAFTPGGFASNGFGIHSPGGYSLLACAIAEIIGTAFFVMVVMGVTARKAHGSLAPLAIGLTLTLIHLAILPVSGASVNPARSTATAIVALVGGTSWPIIELWLFWVAPVVGGAIGGWAYREIFADE